MEPAAGRLPALRVISTEHIVNSHLPLHSPNFLQISSLFWPLHLREKGGVSYSLPFFHPFHLWPWPQISLYAVYVCT